MSLLCKIGIHDYKKKNKVVVTRNKTRFSFMGACASYEVEGLLTLYKCNRCGKESASVHLETGETESVPVWKARSVMYGEV